MIKCREIALVVCVVGFGLSAIYTATDGARAWTAEAARRLRIEQEPLDIGAIVVRNQDGSRASIADLSRPILLLNFMFTQCASLCPAMGYEFQNLQRQIAASPYANKVQFLSITFDPANDDFDQLQTYLARFGATDSNWQAARVASPSTLSRVLRKLDVVIIPDERMGFIHNDASYLVHDGRLVAIGDYDDPQLLQQVLDLAANVGA